MDSINGSVALCFLVPLIALLTLSITMLLRKHLNAFSLGLSVCAIAILIINMILQPVFDQTEALCRHGIDLREMNGYKTFLACKEEYRELGRYGGPEIFDNVIANTTFVCVATIMMTLWFRDKKRTNTPLFQRPSGDIYTTPIVYNRAHPVTTISRDRLS